MMYAEVAKTGSEVLSQLDQLSRLTARELALPDAGEAERLESLMTAREAAISRAAPLLERLLAAPREGSAPDLVELAAVMVRVEAAAREIQAQDAQLMAVLAARRAEIGAELEQLEAGRAASAAYGGGGRGSSLNITR